ncbi:hypothetical protein GC105_10045 [Alkalibaculum sp. M08DMB]|uniref:Uncharacterized protein n=1 Tax=Alkalibaculum sporogenes TaxID=2655001 RepID=A0A6A7K9K0_9FIRM|nr:hypothetical protein [Alkalibaculum sporogenes]MPW26130.1 hypothetical protein [Alkalibaculum sporogenes]
MSHKQDFVPHLEKLFHHLVDVTEPICHNIDSHLASMLIYDTTGIEAFVTENNDKFLNSIIRRVKSMNKGKSSDHINNIAYSKMPKVSSANDEIRKMYINGKFCYAYKFGILTNGLGIVRDITCFDRIKPVISNFLNAHPTIHPKIV